MTLAADESEMVELVRDFVDRKVTPRVQEFEETDTYPSPASRR